MTLMEFGITSTKEYEPPPHDDHALYRVKGMLTKFMRMIFPLEFRIDSLPNSGATLPFHYPLIGGEMIYLPETVAGIGGADMAHDYFVLTAAHLAGRHEFGTFAFELAAIPGFEERSESGVEAIDGYVASFDDPALAGALMRLCESARIDAELCRRYRGLTTRVARMHAVLAETLRPEALSTLLVKAALDVTLEQDDPAGVFIHQAESFFAPLRAAGATVTQSALQTGALFQWLQELMAAARAAGRAIWPDAAPMRCATIYSARCAVPDNPPTASVTARVMATVRTGRPTIRSRWIPPDRSRVARADAR